MTILTNLGFTEFEYKTYFYDSMQDPELMKDYLTPNVLMDSTIEYFYDKETNCLLFETNLDQNIIIPCSNDNIKLLGEQFYYKLAEDPKYNESLFEKERLDLRNKIEIDSLSDDKKLSYLTKKAQFFMSLTMYDPDFGKNKYQEQKQQNSGKKGMTM